ncbi:MAG: epimerase [Hyphomicrobiales bacterium]|nr:MAG: epimerase [Hyphomicrobiales bacterium]
MLSAGTPWRIAVSGLGGFVGSHFAQAMAAMDPTIEVIPLLPAGLPASDLRNASAVAQAVSDLSPNVVLHLAAMALPASASADPTAAWQVNVMGTLNIAEAVRRHSPRSRLLFVGSSEAYGNSFLASDEPIEETAALMPRSIYAATKAAADLMMGQCAIDGVHTIRFRPFNHTGPGQSDNYVVSSFARQIARIERGLQPPVIDVGNLEAERDFLDVRDVVDAYARAALPNCNVAAGTVMNLATGQPKRIGAVLSELIDETPMTIDVRIDPSRVRANDIPRASGSRVIAQETLGWRPRIDFRQTLRDVLSHWRASPL